MTSQQSAALKTFPVYPAANIPTSFKPNAIAYAGDGTVYVAGTGALGARLVRLYLLNNYPLFDVALPPAANPTGIAVCGGVVCVANYGANSLSFFDSISGVLLETVAIPSTVGVNPESILCTGTSLWVAFNSSRTVAEYDIATRDWVRTETVGKWPGGLAHHDGHLFVTVGGNNEPPLLKKFNITNGAFSLVWEAAVGTYPLSIVQPGDGSSWVGSYYGCNVTRVDNDGIVTGTYALNGTARGGASDGNTVVFSVFPYGLVGTTHNMSTFDLDGNLVGEYPVGQWPRAIAFCDRDYYVANSDSLFLTKM